MSELALRRSARQRWAAAGSSHDRLIGRARVLLPMAVVGLGALLALAPLAVSNDISFVLSKDRVAVARERLRVSEARYRGADAKGQPFELTARSAVQTSSRDPVVRLDALSARIALSDGPAVIRAPKGRYNMETERVNVDGPILVEGAGGYRLETRDVAVDLKTRRVASAGAVDGRMPLGTFRADRLSADLEAGTIQLAGRVRLHIDQRQRRGAP